MIAKSILSALLIAYSISGNSKSASGTNYYGILKEYGIHPPALKYAYPLWYAYDSLPVTGIIYLKEDLTDLHKINDITYVAEPTKENAEIIFNFSGPQGHSPKFYIVPDSDLTWRQVLEFVEYLSLGQEQTRVLFCGGDWRYFNVDVSDLSANRFPERGCGNRSVFTVMNNCSDQLLVEGEFLEADSLFIKVKQFYWGNYGNYGNEPDYRAIFRDEVDTSLCLDRISDFESMLQHSSDLDALDRDRVNQDIQKWKKRRSHSQKQGTLFLPISRSWVYTKFQFCDRLIGDWYAFMESINKGVYLSREMKAIRFSDYTYAELFDHQRLNDLEYIHLEFPDLLHHYFNNQPPPEIYQIQIAEPVHVMPRTDLIDTIE